MTTLKRLSISAAVISLVLATQLATTTPATLLDAAKVPEAVAIRNLVVKEGAVSGELVNRSSRALRDVQLLIRHTWHWIDELHPGKDSPGTAVYFTVEKEIAPGGAVPFAYKPASPLPSRPDGYFEISVSVAGFSEVFR